MRTDVRLCAGLAAGLLGGLLWLVPPGASAQSEPSPSAARPAKDGEGGTSRKPDGTAGAARSPKPTPARKPPKVFQPSDQIPADVPSTFPTDI